jgi:SAM-dependent methyltransferase
MTDSRPSTDAADGSGAELDQTAMVSRLPRTEIVDRIAHLTERARGRRVIHVGFADVSFHDDQLATESWLHQHLAEVADSLVGIDLDAGAVEKARAQGYEAYAADCTDVEQLAALHIEPADLVIAGEVIEHVGAPGSLLTALRTVCAPDGALVVTTPNAYGLLNVVASIGGFELNHPDHVVMFTWRTLTSLMARCGWEPVAAHTYVPQVRKLPTASRKLRFLAGGARTVLGLERFLGRVGAPFSADGLIVEATPSPERTPFDASG